MREIRYIRDRDDWNQTIEKNKYLVVNFTATWCGPCNAIKPFVNELYQKPEYRKLEFVRVDTDTVPDVCNQYEVQSIPTFIFLELKKEVERLTSNIPHQLPEKLNSFAEKASKDTSVGERSSLSLSNVLKEVKQYVPSGFELLNDTIHFGDSVALNCMSLDKKNSDVKNILRLDAKGNCAVYTDADSQGLFFVQLNNISKVHSILLKLRKPEHSESFELDEDEMNSETQLPSIIKVWANKPSILSFDDASGDSNAQNITQIESVDASGWYEVKLKYVRFQSVQTLNIFIDGENEDNHTIIEKIVLVGLSGSLAKSQPINTDD